MSLLKKSSRHTLCALRVFAVKRFQLLPLPGIPHSPAPLRQFLLALLLLVPLPLFGASSPLRPHAGRELLLLPATAGLGTVTVYEYPGVRRKGELPVTELPPLASSVSRREGEIVLAVFALREGFARVAVSASGEGGWLEINPGWRVVPWERYLPGRTVRLRKGLRETASRIRQTPAESGETVGTVSAGSPLPVSEVRDDWGLVSNGEGLSGWLRWRDGDGRLLVTVE